MTLTRIASPRFLAPTLSLATLLASTPPAHAANCIQNYAECLVRAADLDTWWQRSAAGIDCYLDAVACVRAAYF